MGSFGTILLNDKKVCCKVKQISYIQYIIQITQGQLHMLPDPYKITLMELRSMGCLMMSW